MIILVILQLDITVLRNISNKIEIMLIIRKYKNIGMFLSNIGVIFVKCKCNNVRSIF